MTEDHGRVPLAPGSHEPSPDGLGPSGFDPSRVELPNDLDRASYEGKPRHLLRDERDALESFVENIRARLAGMSVDELWTVVTGCLHVSPINCWCVTYAIADVIYPFAAEEIEKRRDSDGSGEAGETGTGSTEGDSAGPKGIAQNCRIGSCQRHQACMYNPCRSSPKDVGTTDALTPDNPA